MGVDTDEFENVDDAFRGAVIADESVLAVEFDVADDFRTDSGVDDATEDFLRMLSSSLVGISMIWPPAIPAEYIERFLAGRDIIVLCLSLLKSVPVIA